MTRPPAAERRHRVELFEIERITARGRSTTTWLVRDHDAWVRAAEHPAATHELLESGPGTVWEKRIEVELPVGARLQRIDSEPAPEQRREVLEHLIRPSRGPRRRTRRVELSVGPRGELVPARRTPG